MTYKIFPVEIHYTSVHVLSRFSKAQRKENMCIFVTKLFLCWNLMQMRLAVDSI